MRLLVDTDNALGSPRGDVDDGLAVAALLQSPLAVAAVSSVAGNTSEARAHENNRRLGALCGFAGPYLRGVRLPCRGGACLRPARGQASCPPTEMPEEVVDEAEWLWSPAGGDAPLTVAALGPLTNLAAALAAGARRGREVAVAEVIVVGGNLGSRGRWPPLWPHELNLTHDRAATRAVWESGLPLTVVPLDVARRLRVGPAELAELRGELGEALRRGCRRWLRRARLLRASRTFPAYDLLAAACLVAPEAVERRETAARLHRNAWIEWGAGGRRVDVVRDCDPAAIWRRFAALVSARPAGVPPRR